MNCDTPRIRKAGMPALRVSGSEVKMRMMAPGASRNTIPRTPMEHQARRTPSHAKLSALSGLPAPSCCPTSVVTATPIPIPGIQDNMEILMTM